ncbi:MAG: hypothetical protein ACSHYF_06595 [Verrucomicrobiaceae bacterium]
MKSSLVIHGVWAVVAVASFAVGSQFFDKEAGDVARDGEGGATTGQSVRVASRDGDRGEDSRGGARNQMGSREGSVGYVQASAADIEAMGAAFKNGKGPIERRLAFTKMLEALTPENAKAMREQILHLSERSDEWREFHYAWGAIAGSEAVLHGKDSEERDMSSTFAGWASADPAAAVAWFNGLSDEEKNDNDLKWGAAFGLADTDPNAATQFAMERQAAGDRDAGRMMDIVARNLMRTGDFTEALSWSENLPKGDLQDAAVRRVADEFAEEDPAGAVSWLERLPEGSAQSRGMDEAFSEWARENPVAAAEKLNEMPVSAARDAAINGYAGRLAWEDTATALEWAGAVNDPKMRENTLVEVGQAYYRRNREEAVAWLQSSGLSEAAQKRVTERRRR